MLPKYYPEIKKYSSKIKLHRKLI